MIWYQTFSGAALYDESGLPMTGAATQRRTIGILAVLAVAGDAGVSRDKLIGIFWPDRSTSRARHSLTQALYAARKALNCDDLFETGEDIRLNPARLRADVSEFTAALRIGDHETAVSLYRGTFLDGFFLSTREFDEWLTRERSRLENEYVAAIERLIARANEEDQTNDAIDRLKLLASVRRSDARVTLRLMHALADSGDRGASIQHALSYEKVMRESFEMEPDPAILDLAQQLRKPISGRPVMPAAEPLDAERPEPLMMVPLRQQEPPRAARSISAAPRLSQQRRSRTGLSVVLLMLVTAMVFVSRRKTDESHVLRQSVVVAPFRVDGADASLAYLREGMVELLSARLSDDTAARSIDAGVTLRAWRKSGVTRNGHAARDEIVRLASRFGAERVIVGTVVGNQAKAVLSAEVVSAPSGRVSAQATVDGPLDSLTVLVDRLAAKLLLKQAGEDDRLAYRTTASLPALRAYLAGASAAARGDFAMSTHQYEEALRIDESFSVAALNLALVGRRLNHPNLERTALERALLTKSELSTRDQAHLQAIAGPNYPAPSSVQAALESWETAALQAPNRSEVWYGLASTLAQSRAFELSGNEHERVMAVLARALDLDSEYWPALMLYEKLTGQLPADSSIASPVRQPFGPFRRWLAAAIVNDTSALAWLSDSLTSLGPSNLRALAAVSQHRMIDLDGGERALRILLSRAPTAADALDVTIALHSDAVNRGRPAGALALTRQMQRLAPAARFQLHLRVLDAIYADGDSTAAAQAAAALETPMSAPRAATAADACVTGLWSLHRSDAIAARRSIDQMRDLQPAHHFHLRAPVAHCVLLVEAGLAVATKEPSALGRVQALDTINLLTPSAGDVAMFANLHISRLYRQLGNPHKAYMAVRRRPFTTGWPRYLAPSLREEGELALLLGDTAAAVLAYGAFLKLRVDPEYTTMADAHEARAILDRLASGVATGHVADSASPE